MRLSVTLRKRLTPETVAAPFASRPEGESDTSMIGRLKHTLASLAASRLPSWRPSGWSPPRAVPDVTPGIQANDRRPLLRMVDVGKTFYMGEVAVEVLRNVSPDRLEGEMLVMVGPSGSGKTTLLNLLGGVDTATHGQACYRDRDLNAFRPAELTRYRRDKIGFVFQFYNLVPNLTARENVLVATEISDDPLDVDETLQLVGLEHRRDHFPSQLSGGEQQRVAVAR